MKIKMVAVFQAVKFGKTMHQSFGIPDFDVDFEKEVFTITKPDSTERVQFHVTNAPWWVLNDESVIAVSEKPGLESTDSSGVSGEVPAASTDVATDSQKDAVQTTRRVHKRPLKN